MFPTYLSRYYSLWSWGGCLLGLEALDPSSGSRNQELLPYHQSISTPSQEDSQALGGNEEQMSSKRLMIGSTAPTCTYNECRGCKYKCRAEQVPVEGNDPIHSAYHYKCICHR
ncbi:hypothetical protein D5086_005519 [Populus alba]|uniref:Uncharacterized protein n=1 Tax=Populus alba TaxID=43335 RepID=A0ACC4CTG7_POPAL